ncbi:uncharacterized protein [Linepithema humile]
MLGGRLLYETLYKNLPLPSPTSISRYLQENGQKIVEGELRCDQLKSYLRERNLPPTIWISEDATRITGKIQYDSSTNQLIGLVLPLNKDGMPISYSFLARSAKEIEHHFSKEKTASLVYAIMAQPIAEHTGPFCLSLFGTDNKFTSQDVITRWKFVLKELAKFGITVLGFSSDGDPRLLKAMRTEMHLGISQVCSTSISNLTSNWPWFNAIYTDIGFVQDTIHIATKFRNRLLKPSILLPFGNKLISVSHLKILINIVSKDKHLLSLSDIESKDKMNFESANKISQEYVRKLLLNHIPDSEGTVLYLKLLNYIILSYTDLYLTPLERLSKLWYCVFIIRIWRNWIKGNRKYTLTDNFLSLNCYACIEINAHSMINMIQKLRDCNMPHLFMPPLFSSQPCEAFFRQIRSMSTTYSTIVNCSLLDVIHRIKKIQLQTDILASKLNKNISFPRIEYKVKTIQIQPNLPTNDDIYEAIEKARKKAITDAHKFDLEPGELNCNLPLIVDARVDDSKADFFDGENRDENDILYDYVDGTRENSTITSASIRASTSRSMEQEDDEFPAKDILEDVSTLSCMSDGYLNMKNYGETTLALSKTSPFTIVADARGKEMVVRKSSIC